MIPVVSQIIVGSGGFHVHLLDAVWWQRGCVGPASASLFGGIRANPSKKVFHLAAQMILGLARIGSGISPNDVGPSAMILRVPRTIGGSSQTCLVLVG